MSQQQLPRTLGFKTALSLVVGSIIGSAIYMRPVDIVQLLGSPWMVIIAWILGGLFTLFMLMVMAEIAAIMPEEGGLYAIMRNIYGDFWGYLFGWASFVLVNCAGNAGVAFIFSQYLGFFVKFPSFSAEVEKSLAISIPMVGTVYPLEAIGVKICTVAVISILTWVSYRSTKSGGNLSVFFTITKLGAILILVAGFVFGDAGSLKNLVTSSATIHPEGIALLLAMVAALNATLQAYDGSQNMLYIMGEIKNPGRNIPFSLIWGVFICMFVYILVNIGLMYVLGMDGIANSQMVASDAAMLSLGSIGAGMVAIFICISVLGTVNSGVLASPRLTFAMARDGHFLRSAGDLDPRFNTPGNALILHLVFMVLFVLTGSFYMLVDMYIFIVWIFNLFFIAGLFILRKRMPDANRPYKVWFYPWLPLLVFIGNALFLALVVVKDISNYRDGKAAVMNSVAALVLTAMGIPIYYFFRWRNRRLAD
jgi:APA family basic amino acid/polyamine antiporter